MSADADLVINEREAIRQYADRYAQQGYQVSVEPSSRELPEFLRTLAPDMIARRDGENIAVHQDLLSGQPDFLIGAVEDVGKRGIIEDDDYAVLHRGLATRNAIADGIS